MLVPMARGSAREFDPEDCEACQNLGHHLNHHEHHPVLIDADEDRFKWRAAIRRDPRKLFFYRIGVAVLGLLMMIVAGLTGPLPGPGGIPLFLLGLAVWASEFEWANRVMDWFKKQFDHYLGWNRPQRLLFWLCFFGVMWAGWYVTMLFYGIPPWLPRQAIDLLDRVPGLRVRQ